MKIEELKKGFKTISEYENVICKKENQKEKHFKD